MPASPAHTFLKTVAAVLLLVSTQAATQALRLTKVEATGLKQLTTADVSRLAGLSVDQSLAPADLDAAASKLASSGFFTDVKYKYVTSAQTMSVTFEVQEVPWNIHVVYDNFVWFDDAELTKAVREAISSFDGMAPEGGAALDLISHALAQALAKRGIPGRVDYKPFVDLITHERQHVFAVTAPAVKLCALHINGAAGLAEADLVKSASALIGADYSRVYLVDFARKTLTQPYRRQGYWRATYGPPSVSAGSAAGCDGAAVALHVDEGLSYTWDHADWSGNTAINAATLDTLLGFKPGDVADSSRIEAGLRTIEAAHGKLGYLAEKATFVPALDDATKRATFKFSVAEGPQFHMGTFAVVGLPEKDQQALAKKWKLQPGDVYDATYIDEFIRNDMRPFVVPPHAVSRELSSVKAAVVDVKLVIK